MKWNLSLCMFGHTLFCVHTNILYHHSDGSTMWTSLWAPRDRSHKDRGQVNCTHSMSLLVWESHTGVHAHSGANKHRLIEQMWSYSKVMEGGRFHHNWLHWLSAISSYLALSHTHTHSHPPMHTHTGPFPLLSSLYLLTIGLLLWITKAMTYLD